MAETHLPKVRLHTTTRSYWPMNTIAIEIHKMQEAYAVMHGIPVERRFSDRELEGYMYELGIAENDIREMETNQCFTNF